VRSLHSVSGAVGAEHRHRHMASIMPSRSSLSTYLAMSSMFWPPVPRNRHPSTSPSHGGVDRLLRVAGVGRVGGAGEQGDGHRGEELVEKVVKELRREGVVRAAVVSVLFHGFFFDDLFAGKGGVAGNDEAADVGKLVLGGGIEGFSEEELEQEVELHGVRGVGSGELEPRDNGDFLPLAR
jgi:hypothetical protein